MAEYEKQIPENWKEFYGKDCGCRTCQRYRKYVDSLAQKPEEPKMKIAGHDVTEVTRESAKVGCTRVTLAEAEKLVAEMRASKTFVIEGYHFYPNSTFLSSRDSAKFTLCGSLSEPAIIGDLEADTMTICKARVNISRFQAKELLTFLQDYFQRFPEAK